MNDLQCSQLTETRSCSTKSLKSNWVQPSYMCWQQPPPRAEGSPVSTIITPELLLKFPHPVPALGEESWLLETSVHTQGHTPRPLLSRPTVPEPPAQDSFIFSAFSVRSWPPSKPSSSLLSYKTQNRARRGQRWAKDFPSQFLQIPESLHMLVEQSLLLHDNSGRRWDDSAGGGVGESEIQPLRASWGTRGPTVINVTIPGTTSFSLGPSGPVGDYWRSAFGFTAVP